VILFIFCNTFGKAQVTPLGTFYQFPDHNEMLGYPQILLRRGRSYRAKSAPDQLPNHLIEAGPNWHTILQDYLWSGDLHQRLRANFICVHPADYPS
jgi:hypothetical protein